MQFNELGPYRLGKQLGQGGMGTVYEGFDVAANQAAAVKVLSPALAADPGFRVRFEAEIESLKKLRHPHIVRLYGYGEQGGVLFYAMELVQGTSLEDELRRGRRFNWREVTQIAVKLCKALKHAHDHGVIHRDLKPANLLVTADGDVRLSDFGIARLFGNTRLTSEGGVLGTAEYMAPEQADGRTITDRCDQYSLGAVMYALLAGRPPFRASSLVEMLHLQRYAEPEPVARFAPQTPDEMARIVHQLLAKDPHKRFPNALILARSLEAMERGLSVARPDDDDFHWTPPGDPDRGASGYQPLSPTLSPEEVSLAARRNPAGPEPAMVVAPDSQAAPHVAGEARVEVVGLPGRFTKVDEHGDARGAIGETLAASRSPQTLALLAALALLVAGGWYLMRPPSADELYERIAVATATDDPRRLQTATADIDAFLARFPDDARVDKVQSLADGLAQSSPVERAYFDALRFVRANPDQALAGFQALVDVYDDGADGTELSRRYVTLSQRQITRLKKRVDAYVAEGRTAIEARLARADELVATDPPAAEKIYQGVVQLYRDKPWAADLVSRSQAALQAARARPAAR